MAISLRNASFLLGVEQTVRRTVKRFMNAAILRDRARYWWRKEIRWWLAIGLVVFSLRSSLADWSDVPTGSMKPTILEGDRVFVNKLAYDLKVPFTTRHLAEWSNPHRGDIVVFFSPRDGQRLVKRVVGLPGDLIELRRDGLVLNGQPVEYKPIAEDLVRDLAPADRARQIFAMEQLPGQCHVVAAIPSVPALRDFGPYRVPEGCYFMMGDNRDNSFDSRYFGPVERRRIVGRATAVVLSFDRARYWLPRWQRFFTSLDG
jgi:signal peptidase I